MLSFILCFTFKKEFGADWVLLFRHNSTGGVMFSNLDEAKNCDLPQKYSIIGNITNNSQIDGKFEFLLEYPGTSGYNRWKQTNFPLWEPETGNLATGFEAINLTWTGNSFGGLFKSKQTATLLDGSRGDSLWYYAIGTIANSWSSSYCSPAGHCFPGSTSSTKCVVLWMRVREGPYYNTKANKVKSRLLINLLYGYFVLT